MDRPDIDAYLRRIGYAGGLRSADVAHTSGASITHGSSLAPTLDSLRALHLHHAQSIAFENLDSLSGRPPNLDLPSLERKLVYDGRGGYCFEQNLLFSHVLREIGFRVTGLAARVLWNS